MKSQTNTDTSTATKAAVQCKNCGCTCHSNFCPDCGQSVLEKRLENKSFFLGLVSGLSRINRGFLSTAWQLLIHPWSVIRDYIQCKRIRYVSPVGMLILVCFINTIVSGIISPETHPAASDIASDQVRNLYKGGLFIANFLMNNTIAQNLTMYIPALLAIPVVYGKSGAGKYNIAEYLTAMIYMASALLIFSTISSPVQIVSEVWYSRLEVTYSIIICALSMYHAFPMPSLKRRILYLALYLLVAALIYILILTVLLAGFVLGAGKSPF